MAHTNRLRSKGHWFAIASILFAAGCGGSSEDDNGGDPTYNPVGDTISENEDFVFVAGPPGAYPGVRVEVEFDGETLVSREADILLAPYEEDIRYERGESALEMPDIWMPPAGDAIQQALLPDYTVLVDVPGSFQLDAPASREEHLERTFADTLSLLEATPNEDWKANDCQGRVPGQSYADIGTFGGRTIWNVLSFTVTLGGADASYAWATHYAPEGIYITLQAGVGVSFPQSFAGIGISQGVGMLIPPTDPERFTASTIEGLSIGMSFDIGTLSTGFTMFRNGPPGSFFHRGIQLDVGWGFSASLLGIAIPFPFGISYANGVVTTELAGEGSGPAFIFVGGYESSCSDMTKALEMREMTLDGSEAVAELTSLLQDGMDQPVTDAMSALRVELATASMPLLQGYTVEGTTPVEGIAASTNGSWLGEFGRNDINALCQGCASTTVDGILADSLRRMQLAGENPNLMYGAVFDNLAQFHQAWPQPFLHSASTDTMTGGIDAAFAQAYETAARLRGDENRYTSDEVVFLEGAAGEDIPFRLTAQEVAALIGRPVEDVANATVCIEGDLAGPRVEPTCVILDGPEIGGNLTVIESTRVILRFSVDLTTADGDFPDDVDTWYVQPSLRVLGVTGARPTRATIIAPTEIFAGAPLTLNAALLDDWGNLAGGEATYTFIGPGQQVLGAVTSSTGNATLQVQVDPQTPTADSLRNQTIVYRDGSEVAGYVVSGSALSGSAEVLINDLPILDYGFSPLFFSGSQLALVPSDAGDEPPTAMPGGTITLEVINPGGLSSGAVTVEVEPEP